MVRKIINNIFKVNVYYEDTDAGGIAYHTSYLRFAERARTELFKIIAPEIISSLRKKNFLFVVKNLSINYIKPCFLFDNLVIESFIKKIKKASIIMDQIIYRQNKKVCTIQLILVSIDSKTKEIKKIEENLTNKLQHLN